MPLDRQVTNVLLQEGLAEDISPFAQQPGQLAVAENIRFTKDGSVEKRKGHTLVFNSKLDGSGFATTLNTGEGRLASYGDELIAFDGRDVVSYGNASTSARQLCVAPRFTATTHQLGGAAGLSQQVLQQASTVYSAGGVIPLVVVASLISGDGLAGDVYAEVYDHATGVSTLTFGLTGNLISDGTANSHSLHVITLGTTCYVLWGDSATTNKIYSRRLDMLTRTWAATDTLVTDCKAVAGLNLAFDAKPFVNDSGWYGLVYLRSTDKIRVCKVRSDNGLLSTVDLTDTPGAPTYSPTGFGICGTAGGKIFVTYGWDQDDTNRVRLKLSRVDYTAVTEDGGFPITLRMGGWSADPSGAGSTGADGEFCLTSGCYPGSSSTEVYVTYCTFNYTPGGTALTNPWAMMHGIYKAKVLGTTVSKEGTLGSTRLLSAPFTDGGRYYVVAQRDSGEWKGAVWNDVGDPQEYGGDPGSNQSTAVLLDLRHSDTASPVEVTVLFPLQLTITDGASVFRPVLNCVPLRSAFANVSFVLGHVDSAVTSKKVSLVKLDDSDKYRWNTVEAAGALVVGGGLVAGYDRKSLYPINFIQEPRWFRIGEYSNAGGAGWDTTKHYYGQFLFERVDAMGRITRSATDFGVKHGTTGGSTSIGRNGILEFANFKPTNANSQMKLAYPFPHDGWDDYASPHRARPVIYMGSVPDVAESVRRLTQGSIYTAAPGTSGYAAGAVFSGAYTAPLLPDLYAEQPYTLGAGLNNCQPPSLRGLTLWDNRLWGIDHTQRQLWFSKEATVGELPGFVPDFTIPVPFDAVALGVMDSYLVVFGKDRIGVLQGSGPSDSGTGLNYSSVQLVCTDHGCAEPRSIVQTPVGLMYQAPHGIALFDRGFSSKYIGEQVRETLTSYPVITSAVVHPTETVVLFTCTDTAGSTGRRLVYDYRLGRWSVDILIDESAVLSQVVCGGVLYLLTASGTVYAEDSSSYLDNGAWVTSRVRLAFARLGGLLGYQRVWRVGLLGTRYTDHDCTISVYTDDRSSPDQTRTYPHATTSLTAPEHLQLRVKRQLCRALSVEVSDAEPTGGTIGTGRGFSLAGIALELGIVPDMQRSPANRRV